MPYLNRDHYCLAILLLCIPAQFCLNHYFSFSYEVERSSQLKRLLDTFTDFRMLDKLDHWKQSFFRIDSGKHVFLLAKSMVKKIFLGLDNSETEEFLTDGESPAIEVLNYRGAGTGYFADSPHVRSPRLKSLKYRVGQVVSHEKLGFRGVIVGWDPVAKAPETWLHQMYDKEGWRSVPHYAILVDMRDRTGPQRTYIPEDSITLVKATEIVHPWLDDYFDGYDGAQYLPRPWLKFLYPHD